MRHTSTGSRYIISAFVATIAVAVRIALQPLFGDQMPFITLFAAVVFAAWFGGRYPALLALALCVAGAAYSTLPPVHSLSVERTEQRFGLLLFVGIGLAIIAVFDAMHRAVWRAEDACESLQNERVARQRADESLQISLHRFQVAAEAVNGIVYEYDFNKRSIERTRGLGDVLGCGDEDAAPSPTWWVERIHPDDRERSSAVFVESLRAGQDFVLHYRMRHQDGRWVHIEDRAVPLRHVNGRPMKMIGCALDVSLRVTAVKALQRSESMFRSLVAASSQAVWRYKPGGTPINNIDEAGASWWRAFTGQSEAQRIADDGMGWLESVHPVDRAKATSFWTQVLTHAEPVLTEYRLRRRDGEWRHVRVQAAPVIEDDVVVEWAGMINDVSDERAAERALALERSDAALRLQASFDELHLVTDHVPVLIFHSNRQGHYMFVNRPYSESLGRTPADLVGKRVDETLGQEAWRLLAPHVDMVLRGIQHDFDIDIPQAIGGWRFMRCRYVPERDASGLVIGFIGAMTDISDRKVMEDAMRASEQSLRLIVDSALDYAIVTLDSVGRVTSWNSGAQKVTGFEAADVLNNHVRMIYTAEDREQRQPEEELARAAASGRADNTRWHIRKDGSRYWASGSVMPLLNDSYRSESRQFSGFDTSGHGFLLVMRDMTEQRRAEEEREGLLERLRLAERRKDEFLAIAAHELRNPLGVMLNGVELISLNAEKNSSQERALELMHRQGLRMERLINDIFEANRVSGGDIQLAKHRIPLSAILREAIEISRIVIEDAGHQFSQSIETDDLLIEGDAISLTQVFTILLTNSAKYAARNGHIRLTARREAREVVIEVQDNGEGTAAGIRVKVFDLYTQVDRADVEGGSGLGLGLALVKRLIERHDGSIYVTENVNGVGSCFTVRLPLLSFATQRGSVVAAVRSGEA